MDILVANFASNNIGVLLGYGNGSFGLQMTHPTGNTPKSVAIGDLNNDTLLDIVAANFGDSTVTILFGCLNEVFVKETVLTITNGSRPRSIVIGDFNNDDLLDIGTANTNTHQIGIFLGYGNVSFGNEQMLSTGPSSFPYSLAVCDFDNDTRLDLVVTNYGVGTVGIFLGYRNGFFPNQTSYQTGALPYSVAVTDFDNDYIHDILVVNYGTNNVGVLRGHGDGTFADVFFISMKYESHPFFVLTGDFNNDKKLDFAVANNGTDSLYIFLQIC